MIKLNCNEESMHSKIFGKYSRPPRTMYIKIRFRSLLDLRIQFWLFLKKRTKCTVALLVFLGLFEPLRSERISLEGKYHIIFRFVDMTIRLRLEFLASFFYFHEAWELLFRWELTRPRFYSYAFLTEQKDTGTQILNNSIFILPKLIIIEKCLTSTYIQVVTSWWKPLFTTDQVCISLSRDQSNDREFVPRVINGYKRNFQKLFL